MNSLAVGLASGLGNCVCMLPAVKALKLLGHRISLHVQTDFATGALWRRYAYVDEVLEPPGELNGHQLICGQWRPAAWTNIHGIERTQVAYPYVLPEWRSNMRLAERRGWPGPAPDVSDWCGNLDRRPRWDIGIVPGSKGGAWLRKRWPGMAGIAEYFLSRKLSVAVFGQTHDGVEEIPGEHIETPFLAHLPDTLAGCRIIIGTDSGVTHLASSLGIPVVVVFTATSEIKGQPAGPHRIIKRELDCRPCQSTPLWNKCRIWKCHKIGPDSVIQAAEELLG